MYFRSLWLKLLSSFVILFYSCHDSQKDAGKYAGLSDSAHYVGMNTCRQCHTDIYNTFIQTGMGQSFDLATHAKSSARFDEHALIHDSIRNLSYHPYWLNDSLMLDEFRLSGVDTVYKRTERIRYIVGSGQHTNSHMIYENGYVFQAPATFFTQSKKWDLPPGFEGGFNSRFSRKIELECMSCHNAYPEIVKGSENKYLNIPHGIDCERCHGPGSIHVALKQQRELIDTSKYIDYSIVNPAKLPVALQLDICQRCHIQGNAVLAEGKSFLDFRPGMKLSDVMNVFMPVYKGDEDAHIMASHAERLKMSKCFQATLTKIESKQSSALRPYKNALTCVTCHNPHVSVKSTSSEHFNAVCRNCHNEQSNSGNIHEGSNKLCTEKIEIRNASNNNCVSCHMPKSGSTDIPHVTTTDHFIRKKVSVKTVKAIQEFVRLACINNPKVSNKVTGAAYLNYYEKFVPKSVFLDSAKKYLDDSSADSILSNFRDLIRWAFLKNDYARVLQYVESVPDLSNKLNHSTYSNDDAWTAYRIGESYGYSGNGEKAEFFLQRSVNLEPYNFEFRNKLAMIQHKSGKIEAAVKNYEWILSENPKFASAWINYGYLILSTQQDVNRADDMYAKALALDPDNEQALLNRAGTRFYLGKKKEAKALLDHLLVLNPGNENAKALMPQLK